MANEQMRENWTVGAEGWVAHRDLFDRELAPFGEAVLERAQPGPGQRVLDVGCGTGRVTAGAVARGATAVGVDISPVLIEAAERFVPDASFLVADAQTDDLAAHGPFDHVVSRFGVMFFEDPTEAFANIRRAEAPGGALTFACWRGLEENAMFTLGTNVLVEPMDPPPATAEPGAPGPMAFADPDRVRALLGEAGWDDPSVQPFDAVCDYGRDGTDGVEHRLTLILNTTIGRQAQAQLEPALGPDGWTALLDDVRADLRARMVDGRVQLNGATWLVTARNPG